MLKTKSVYSRIDHKSDGLRIHTARTRGRGLKKTRYDVWMGSLGPSQKLLKDLKEDRITWGHFCNEYKRELLLLGPIDKRSNNNYRNHGQKFALRLIKKLATKGPVTLMCTCDEDEEHCHRHVLRSFIQSKRI
jgi:uncharacterized protein YeaO (DUF488 family)